MATIDAHQHFWQLTRFKYEFLDGPALAPIKRDYLPGDIEPLLDAAGIDRCVFVQTRHHEEETRWVLDLCKTHPRIAGVVGWVDLRSPKVEVRIVALKENPKFVGVRHVVQDDPDDDWIVHDDTLRGLAALEKHDVAYDLLFFVKHLKHGPTVAKRFPKLRFVLDHLSKPRIKDQAFDDWEGNFRELARCPNVMCKLSGMVTEADWKRWKPADLKPYVEIALEAFGPDRLMYGSDWPVCELASTYQRQIDALRDCVGDLSDAEKGKIFGGTAKKFYRLGE